MPLEGIKVVEAATLFAAPLAAMFLGDYGADVIKIEHPTPCRPRARARAEQGRDRALVQGARAEQAARHARPFEARGRRPLPAPRRALRRRARELPARDARALGRRLGRALGGQSAARASRASAASARPARMPSAPGFGTLAEAMSGFAVLNGEPDGAPLLPPLALADGVTALATAFSIMAALRARERDRPRPDRRHLAGRAAADPARPAADRLRPARRAAAAHGQPLQPQRTAQPLPDGRRLLGRRLVERDLDRSACDRARRTCRSGRASPGSRPGSGACRARGRDRRRRRGLDRRAQPRRRAGRVRGGRMRRSRRSTTPATCSPIRSSRRSARSAPSTTRSSGRCGCRT